jgi:hypothetical protein
MPKRQSRNACTNVFHGLNLVLIMVKEYSDSAHPIFLSLRSKVKSSLTGYLYHKFPIDQRSLFIITHKLSTHNRNNT